MTSHAPLTIERGPHHEFPSNSACRVLLMVLRPYYSLVSVLHEEIKIELDISLYRLSDSARSHVVARF